MAPARPRLATSDSMSTRSNAVPTTVRSGISSPPSVQSVEPSGINAASALDSRRMVTSAASDTGARSRSLSSRSTRARRCTSVTRSVNAERNAGSSATAPDTARASAAMSTPHTSAISTRSAPTNPSSMAIAIWPSISARASGSSKPASNASTIGSGSSTSTRRRVAVVATVSPVSPMTTSRPPATVRALLTRGTGGRRVRRGASRYTLPVGFVIDPPGLPANDVSHNCIGGFRSRV